MYYDPGNGSHMSYNGHSDTSCRSPAGLQTNGWPSARHYDNNNGQTMNALNEQSNNYIEQPYYGRPSYHQQEPESSNRMAFLYDRAFSAQPQIQPQPAAMTQQHSLDGATQHRRHSPESSTRNFTGERYANGYHDGDIPPPLPTSSPPSTLPLSADSYRPAVARAMPAPMHQHGGKTTDTSPAVQHSLPPKQSPVNVDRQLSQLGLNDRPPAPGGATCSRNREMNGSSSSTVRSRAMPTSFARRQSAPGPCLPPSADGKKQWSLTPCGFTNTRGQPLAANGRRTPSTPSDLLDGSFTPQSATPRTADGPKLFDSSLRNRSFGSQDSFLDFDNTPQDNAAIDRSSIRYNLREGDDIGDYDQTSIRYTGKTNPSKIFRLLQTATGSDTETEVKMAQAAMRQQVRRRRPTREELDDQHQEQSNSDDIVDIAYVGSNIPSRTFRCLQEAIGTRAPDAVDNDDSTQPRRSVRVIHLRPSIKKHSSMDNILSCSDL